MVNPAGERGELTYTAAGRLLSTRDYDGATISLEYDGAGLPHRVVAPDGAATDFVFDDEQRVVGVRFANGDTIGFERDEFGRETAVDVDGSRWTIDRDQAGRVVKVTDPAGVAAEAEHDPLGQWMSIADSTGRAVAARARADRPRPPAAHAHRRARGDLHGRRAAGVHLVVGRQRPGTSATPRPGASPRSPRAASGSSTATTRPGGCPVSTAAPAGGSSSTTPTGAWCGGCRPPGASSVYEYDRARLPRVDHGGRRAVVVRPRPAGPAPRPHRSDRAHLDFRLRPAGPDGRLVGPRRRVVALHLRRPRSRRRAARRSRRGGVVRLQRVPPADRRSPTSSAARSTPPTTEPGATRARRTSIRDPTGQPCRGWPRSVPIAAGGCRGARRRRHRGRPTLREPRRPGHHLAACVRRDGRAGARRRRLRRRAHVARLPPPVGPGRLRAHPRRHRRDRWRRAGDDARPRRRRAHRAPGASTARSPSSRTGPRVSCRPLRRRRRRPLGVRRARSPEPGDDARARAPVPLRRRAPARRADRGRAPARSRWSRRSSTTDVVAASGPAAPATSSTCGVTARSMPSWSTATCAATGPTNPAG